MTPMELVATAMNQPMQAALLPVLDAQLLPPPPLPHTHLTAHRGATGVHTLLHDPARQAAPADDGQGQHLA